MLHCAEKNLKLNMKMLKRSSPLKKGNSTLKKSPLKKSNNSFKKSGKIKVKPKSEDKKLEEKEYLEKQWELFRKIWGSRPHIDFETGEYIYGELRSTYCHHILEKGVDAYKPYALCEWNIVLVTWETHSQVHTDIDKTPKIKALTQELKQKHLNGEL